MNLTPVKVPKTVTKLFPNFTWSIPSDKKVLYLTFDDGPTPEITDWVLNCLKEYNAKATFFCIGKNVEANPEIYERILNNDHAVGNHTYSHLKGWKSKTKNYVLDTEQASNFIKSKLFRPPYGRIKPKQAKALIKDNYKIVMWSVLSLDWDKSVSITQCFENVKNNVKSGDVIVFHDSIKASRNMMYALPKFLEYFSERGYSFKRIPE